MPWRRQTGGRGTTRTWAGQERSGRKLEGRVFSPQPSTCWRRAGRPFQEHFSSWQQLERLGTLIPATSLFSKNREAAERSMIRSRLKTSHRMIMSQSSVYTSVSWFFGNTTAGTHTVCTHVSQRTVRWTLGQRMSWRSRGPFFSL